MIRDTSILYELANELKENKFINYNNDELISSSQLNRVYQYLDDILIEAFFSTNKFAPIIIPSNILSNRQSPEGYIEQNSDLVLDLSNRFDRYTFVEAICLLCIHGASPYNNINLSKEEQRFLSELSCGSKLYCAYGRSYLINAGFCPNPFIDSFREYYKMIDFGESKAAELCCFRDFVLKQNGYNFNMYYYEHVDYYYSKIKNLKLFGNYTWQEVLSIYSILVEKLKLAEDSISTLISLHIPKETDFNSQILAKFHKFEMNYSSFFNVRSYINYNDLFLRFVNAERSRAFQFKPLPKKNFISIQLFDNPSIEDVDFYNTLPLPYYNNSKQNI